MCRYEYNNPVTTLIDDFDYHNGDMSNGDMSNNDMSNGDMSDNGNDSYNYSDGIDRYSNNDFSYGVNMVRPDQSNLDDDITENIYSDSVNRTNWAHDIAEQLLSIHVGSNSAFAVSNRNVNIGSGSQFIHMISPYWDLPVYNQPRLRAARPHRNYNLANESKIIDVRPEQNDAPERKQGDIYKFLYDKSPANPFTFEPEEHIMNDLSSALTEIRIEVQQTRNEIERENHQELTQDEINERQKNLCLHPDYLD